MGKTFSAEALTAFARRIAHAAGMSADDAATLADSLVAADLIGVSTHGITRLAIYVKRMRMGLINPKAVPRVERGGAAVAVIDGANAAGQVCGCFAVKHVVDAARRMGIAAATVKHSQHFGTASYYGERIARNGMIGIVFTNSEPAMPPWGGRHAFLGTNPISLVAPTGKEFVLRIDMATSVVARGRVIAASKKGEPIPDGWAIEPLAKPHEGRCLGS